MVKQEFQGACQPAEIDVDAIMAYSPYAANSGSSSGQMEGFKLHSDSQRHYVLQRGDVVADSGHPASQQTVASQGRC